MPCRPASGFLLQMTWAQNQELLKKVNWRQSEHLAQERLRRLRKCNELASLPKNEIPALLAKVHFYTIFSSSSILHCFTLGRGWSSYQDHGNAYFPIVQWLSTIRMTWIPFNVKIHIALANEALWNHRNDRDQKRACRKCLLSPSPVTSK